MKKIYSLLVLMMLCITASAQWMEDGKEYFIQNTSTQQWLGGGNDWGTHMSTLNRPSRFKFEAQAAEGVYHVDSHKYNNANDHYIGAAEYLDAGAADITFEPAGEDGVFYIKNAKGYFTSQGLNKTITYLGAPSEESKWYIYDIETVKSRLQNAEETVDATELMENPKINRNGNTSYHPTWTVTGFDGTGKPANWSEGQNGNVADCAESFQSSNGFKAVQVIPAERVVPGVYMFTAQAFYRQDGGDEPLPYFSVNGVKSYFVLKTGSENNMVSSYESFLAEKYPIQPIVVNVAEGEDITIEIVGEAKKMWNIFGEMKLTYVPGNPYQSQLDLFRESLPNYEEVEMKSGAVYDEYTMALEDNNSAETAEELDAAKEAINSAKALLDENIEAWKKLVETFNASTLLTGDDNLQGDAKTELVTMVMTTENMMSEKTATTEEIVEQEKALAEQNGLVIKTCMVAGTDCTDKMLKNPNFETKDGWQGSPAIDTNAKCAERWNGGAFDVYQEVENAPVGVYEISLQGFYRPSRGEKAWGFYFTSDGARRETPDFGDWQENKAYVYLNDAQTLLDNVFNYYQPDAEGNETYDLTERANKPYEDVLGRRFCNDMGDAGKAFDLGAYKVSAFGLIANEGDKMRIGIKGNNFGLDNWVIFTRFKLTYQAMKADVVKNFLDTALKNFNPGNIYGTEEQAVVNAALAEANAALEEGTNGQRMFAATKDLVAADVVAKASAIVFDSLSINKKQLEVAYSNYESTAKEDVKAAVEELVGEIDSHLTAKDLKTEEARAYFATIEKAIKDLRMPAAEGTDDEPVDYTSVIENPDFDKNTIDGWEKTKESGDHVVNFKCTEFFEKTFDMHQTIKNLPAGTYEVAVKAFYRGVNDSIDFARVNKDSLSLARIYAVTSKGEEKNDSVYAYVRRLTTGAINMDYEITGQKNFMPFAAQKDSTKWFYPNNMESAYTYLSNKECHYDNKLIVKVAEGEDLTIGAVQYEKETGGWFIMTKWELISYGAASTKEQGAITSSCENPNPVFDPTATPEVQGVADVEFVGANKFATPNGIIIVKDGVEYNVVGQQK